MNTIRIFCLCFLINTCLQSQSFELDSVVVLQDDLHESSGLLYHDGVFITHNDSGDGPYLYEIDTLTGAVARIVYLSNVTAIDWEDLAADDNYLYIGDFGNNFGNRMDLAVYRISWDDYWQTDTLMADRIQFNYAEQTDFSEQLQTNSFDSETLIATADGLYLFTKNWLDFGESKVYRVPKEPGNYTLSAIDSIVTPGLLTGADYLPDLQRLLFVGYNIGNAFVLELSELNFNDFSTATIRDWVLPLEGSFKTEAITYRDERYAYLSKERNILGEAVLYRLDTDFTTSLEEPTQEAAINVFPNPVNNGQLTFHVLTPDGVDRNKRLSLSLLNSEGKVVRQCVLTVLNDGLNNLKLNVSGMASGVYFYELTSEQLVWASGRVVVE